MTDLEERLRDDLRDAAATIPTELDVDVLLLQGRRRRAARSQRRGIAAMAAVTVVAMVAWLGLTQRVTTGVPDPAASPTAPPPASSVTFRSEPNVVPRSPYEVIEAAESDGVLTVTARKRDADPSVTLTSVALDPSVATGTPISPRLYLWVVPGRVDWVDTVATRGISGAYMPRDAHLPAIDVTVVMVISEKDQTSKNWMDGVIWRAPDGALHSSAGTAVSSATLRFSDRSVVVYRDPGLKQISFFDPMNGRGSASVRDDFRPSDVMKIQMAASGTTRGWERFAIGILPAGARDPRVTTSASGAEVATGTMQPDGAQAFVALHRTTTEPRGALITKVTYTDDQGRTRTYRP